MNPINLLLLTWLHNIYLQPKKFNLLPTAKFQKELVESGMVRPAGKWNHLVISSRGKKILLQNLHLLQENTLFA